MLLGHLQEFPLVGNRNVYCGPNPARGWGGGVHVTKETGRGRLPPSKSGAHAPTATVTSRRERGGASVRGKRKQAPRLSPHLPPAPVRVRGAAAEVRAGPEARRSRPGVCRGSPSSPPACFPRPEPPSARRLAHCWPGLVPGPESDGEAVLTSLRGSCLGAECGNLPGPRDERGTGGALTFSAALPAAARRIAAPNFSVSEVAEALEAVRRAGAAGSRHHEAATPSLPRLLAPKFAGPGPFKGPALRRAHVSGLRKPLRRAPTPTLAGQGSHLPCTSDVSGN